MASTITGMTRCASRIQEGKWTGLISENIQLSENTADIQYLEINDPRRIRGLDHHPWGTARK
jgi:hypothetical protein